MKIKNQLRSIIVLCVFSAAWLCSMPILAKENALSVSKSAWQLVYENDTRSYEAKKVDIQKQGVFAVTTIRRLSKQNPDGYTLNVYAFNCENPRATVIRTGWVSEDGNNSNWLTETRNQQEWAKGEILRSDSAPEVIGAYEIACDKKLQSKGTTQGEAQEMLGSWVKVGGNAGAALELDQTSLQRQDEFIVATLKKPTMFKGETGFEIRKVAFNCATSQASIAQIGFRLSTEKTASMGQMNSNAILRKYAQSVTPNSEFSTAMNIACTTR
jgi:hypothetical protein